MKALTILLLLSTLLLALPAHADRNIAFTIKRQKVIDRLPALCAIERAKLGNPSPWNVHLCARALMIRGMKALHNESESDIAKAEYSARIRAARNALKIAPTPTSAVTTSPTASPTAKPTATSTAVPTPTP